jgi:hypothetical protein
MVIARDAPVVRAKPKRGLEFSKMISLENQGLSDAILELEPFYRSVMMNSAAPKRDAPAAD